MTYDFVELFTTFLAWSAERQDKFLSELPKPARDEFTRQGDRAKQIHAANKHKLHFPENLNVLKM